MPDEQPFRPLTSYLIRKTTMWASICTLLLATVQGWLSYQTVTERGIAKLKQVAVSQAPAYAEALWRVDVISMRLMLEGLRQTTDIGYAEIREPSNYATTSNKREYKAAVQDGDAHCKSRCASTTVPLLRTGLQEPIGELFLTIDPRLVYLEVGRTVAAVLISSALSTCLLLVVIILVLKRDLQRPLTRLSSFVNDLAAAELTQKLDLQRPPRRHRDEIDQVDEGFQLLQGRLAQHIQTLEEKVADRTAHLAQALAELQTLSTTDALTSCRNRLYFSQQLGTEIQRAQRYQRPLSVVFCDIDHFKQVNDLHGHAAGDQLLKATGQLLRGELRVSADWVARYGGEEFVLVLPETALSDAIALAERIRQKIATGPGIHLPDGSELKRTMSFGVAELAADETESALLQRADHLLYEAKRGGRNRVCAAAPVAA
ncbi:sensor domain-containing diguanylate cyclase [Roseateles sp. PN1]|uniref:sensor domain-containing diguanylate cyclase n=1 Tax=Roseateles sp. PN1 TaxID=3137372 RepID=UPI003139BCB0